MTTTEAQEPARGQGDVRLKRKIGMSRRELIRRSAIVGGTLLWTVPAIHSLQSSAHPSGTPRFFCCFCRKQRKGKPDQTRCINPAPQHPDECARACRRAGFTSPSSFHSGPNPINCTEPAGCSEH
jgi:hypothetical protein